MNTHIKYFSLGVAQDKNVHISQSEDIENLDDFIMLDEHLEQSDRFMDKNSYENS